MGDESLHHIMNCYLVSRVWVPVINDDIYSETPNDEYLFRIATTVNRFFEEIDRKDGINWGSVDVVCDISFPNYIILRVGDDDWSLGITW